VIRFLYDTGVRIGEARGAMWSDLDWASSRILIRRQREENGDLSQPKTQAGVRWIPLSPELISALKAHRLATPGDFLFPIDERNFRSRVWHPSLSRAGLRRIRIHDARHTYASHLIAAGVDAVRVAKRLGHSDPGITYKVYAHAFARSESSDEALVLAEFRRRDRAGCDSVANALSGRRAATQVIEKMVPRVGIEPTTRGFSIRCSTN